MSIYSSHPIIHLSRSVFAWSSPQQVSIVLGLGKERKEKRIDVQIWYLDFLLSLGRLDSAQNTSTGIEKGIKYSSYIPLLFLFRLSSSKGIITWFDAGLISKLRLELFVKICCWVCLFFSLQSGLEEIQQKFFNKFFSILLYFSNTSDWVIFPEKIYYQPLYKRQ